MNTQTFEAQAVTDEELMAAAGGLSVPPVSIPAWPLTPNSSVPSAFRGQSSGTPGLGDAGLGLD